MNRLRAYYKESGMPPISSECQRASNATAGAYYCTRESGHPGPCAAVPSGFGAVKFAPGIHTMEEMRAMPPVKAPVNRKSVWFKIGNAMGGILALVFMATLAACMLALVALIAGAAKWLWMH